MDFERTAERSPLIGVRLALFVLLCVLAAFSAFSFGVAGITVRPEELVLIALALLVFLPLGWDRFASWSWTEWLLVAFIAFQIVPTLLDAENRRASLLALGLEAFGALAYFTVLALASSEERLAMATRVFLATVVLNAVVGLAALLSHLALCSSWGITIDDTGAPAVKGLAAEHDIFGSMCTAGALAFLVWWQEDTSLLSRRTIAFGFWVCLAGLAVSLTRGAWLGFVAGAVVALTAAVWRRRRMSARPASARHRVVLAWGLVLAVGGGGALVLGVQALSRAIGCGSSTATVAPSQGGSIASLQGETVRLRLFEWRTALEDLRASPVIGLGTDSYGQRHEQRVIGGPGIPLFLSNLLLRPLYDAGAIGLLLFLGFLVPLLWPSRRWLAAEGRSATFGRVLVVAWIGLAVAYLVTDATILIWPWLPLGLIRAARLQALQGKREPADV
jgi:hypothetical protein